MPKSKITQSRRDCKRKDVSCNERKSALGEITVNDESIKKMFKKATINHIAKAAGFIQRERILDAYNFFYL